MNKTIDDTTDYEWQGGEWVPVPGWHRPRKSNKLRPTWLAVVVALVLGVGVGSWAQYGVDQAAQPVCPTYNYLCGVQ